MLSRGLVNDRLSILTLVLLLLITLFAWLGVILQVPSMTLGAANDAMPADATMSAVTAAGLIAFVGAWAVMMAAMMLPSAAPMLLLYRNVSRGKAVGGQPVFRTWIFVLGYLVVWAAVGIPVYLASQLIRSLTDSNMQLAELAPYGVAAVLALAGAYQFTPFKRVCLRACQSPLAFLMGHWKPGPWGAFRMGVEHGAYCAGCCWGLMAVLVVAGAMGLAWVLLVALVVGVEKLVSRRRWPVFITGAALLGLAVLIAVQPAVAPALRGGMM